MKSLTAFNDTAIDNPHVDLIELVKIEFDGLTLYLCDRIWGDAGSECVFDSQLYEPLILSWNSVNHGKINPKTYEIDPSETSFVIDNSQPVGGIDNFSSLLSIYDPHFVVVTRSQIFSGASVSGDKIDIFKGHIEDLLNMLTDQITVTCSGYELDITNKFSHTIVDETTYPGADPDDIGKMLPQVWGSAKKIPFMSVDAGGLTTIIADITATNPGNSGTLNVSNGSCLPSSGAFTIQIDSEKIRIASQSGNALTLAASGARGYDSTTAVKHNAGAFCAEIQAEYFYIIDHAIKAFDAIFVDKIRQSGNYTAYTGQTGDEHASYPGKACIKYTSLSIIKREVHMNSVVNVVGYSTDGNLPISEVRAPGSSQNITREIDCDGPNCAPAYVNADSENGWAIHYEWDIIVRSYGTTGVLEVFADNCAGTPVKIYEITDGVVIIDNRSATFYTTATNYPSSSRGFRVDANAGTGWDGDVTVQCHEVKVTLFENKGTLSGNSVADTVIGGRVSADIQGFQDDASGTYTGMANALIERPDHILRHLLIDRCGLTSSEVDYNASYRSNASLEDEDCLIISDWNDFDASPAVSEQITFDGKNCFKFDTNASAAGNDYAYRRKNIGSIEELGNRIVVSLSIYCDAIGTSGDDFQLEIERSDWKLSIRVASDGLFVAAAGPVWNEVGTNIIQQDVWQELTFDIDLSAGVLNAKCNVYLGNVLQASDVDCSVSPGGGPYTDGRCNFVQYGNTINDRISYIDWLKVGDDMAFPSTYREAGIYYNTNSFTLAPVLLQKPNVRAFINRIAYQAKSIEFWEAGVHHLVHIPDVEAVVKTLDQDRIDLNQIYIKYTPRIDILNTLSARYARGWSGYSNDEEADRSVVTAIDADSVTKYGTLEGKQLTFPYITGATQAQTVLNWILDNWMIPRLIVSLTGGYYLTDMELGDIVKLSFDTDNFLDKALLGLISVSDKFRVIDRISRSDAVQQIQLLQVTMHEVFKVTDGGGEAFRVTEGEDFRIITE